MTTKRPPNPDPLEFAKYVAEQAALAVDGDENQIDISPEALLAMAYFAEAGPSKPAARILRNAAAEVNAALDKELAEHDGPDAVDIDCYFCEKPYDGADGWAPCVLGRLVVPRLLT